MAKGFKSGGRKHGTLKKWNKYGTPYSFDVGYSFYLGTFVMGDVKLTKTFDSEQIK